MAARSNLSTYSPVNSIQLALGLNFVPTISPNLSSAEGPAPTAGQTALANVVPMSAQYEWLAVQAANPDHGFDAGTPDPVSGYPVGPFIVFLDDLLTGLVDPGIAYTVTTFLPNHYLKDGRWVPGGGNIFKLLANAVPMTQEARIDGKDYLVEILISVEVNE